MSDPGLPREREAEIRAQAARATVPATDLVAAAAHIRRILVESVPVEQRPDLEALLEAARTGPAHSRPRVRALVALVAALVAAGSLAAGMTGVLPDPLQDTLHDSGRIVGVHVPESDEMQELDIVDVPTDDRPLWDDGHDHDGLADGHAHES